MQVRQFRLFASVLFALSIVTHPAMAVGPPETRELTLGFIKLTDMAPLAIAYEKGYFEDEGLDVYLEAQQTWAQVAESVAVGVLDGAHMLAGQPLAMRVGFGPIQGKFVAPLSMDLNGNAITVSNEIWKTVSPNLPRNKDDRPLHPIGASVLRPVVDAYLGRNEYLKLGMVSPTSTHNYELRYWLAAGGIHPGFYDPNKPDASSRSGWNDSDVHLVVTPPPKMPKLLERGAIGGYCVGEPWNQQSVFMGVGVPIITDSDIWRNNPKRCSGSPRISFPRTRIPPCHSPGVTPRGKMAGRGQQRQSSRSGRHPGSVRICRCASGSHCKFDDRILRVRTRR